MATKSTTKGKSSRKKQSTSKRGRPTKKEQKRNRVNRLWSIVFFAVGIVITAMAFVPGEQFWSFLRQNVLFGVFGFSGYFLGPVILYIGGLTLGQKPIELKMVWAMCFIILLSNFIQVFFGGEIAGQNLWRIITELHALGKAKPFSGGRLGVILAVPMKNFFPMQGNSFTGTLWQNIKSRHTHIPFSPDITQRSLPQKHSAFLRRTKPDRMP